MSKNNQRITPRATDYSQWYLDVIEAADLAEHSDVKGCMVIKPYGYAIWENMQKILDQKIKDTGHVNAYFPLFIPKSFLSKEAQHVEGFAKECAVVTHHRLQNDPDGKGVVIDPNSKLNEELIVRPTSETIIYSAYSRWIQSWRDLPLLINQWANVVRWEMRTRLFLRTTEFLWQEGHTAHATEQEAEDEALKMLKVYKEFAENYLAVSTVVGAKTESEKFAGALRTYCVEGMMQDGKGLQMGTAHNLGQNFAKAFEVKFTDIEGKIQYVWQTSWGVSTRLIGALIMSHSDDNGLVLPPAIAPIKIVIVPIWKNDTEKEEVLRKANELVVDLKQIDVNIKIDDRDYLSPGAKFNEWEKKGVPIRVELGPKDIAVDQVVFARRDTLEKIKVKTSQAVKEIADTLNNIQNNLLERTRKYIKKNTFQTDNYDEFKEIIMKKAGFVLAHWDGTAGTEAKIKEETGATIRCLPFDAKKTKGKCVYSRKETDIVALFGQAY